VSFRVRLTVEAADDLEQLFDFVPQRELMRHDGDLDVADRALKAVKNGISSLRQSPFTCRKVGTSPFLRELIISFCRSGYVALFEIVDQENIVVSAVRHQLEDDYH
jgi:plasmid stabilization system protein ParE